MKGITKKNRNMFRRWDVKTCEKNKDYKFYKNKKNFTNKMNKLDKLVKSMVKKIK